VRKIAAIVVALQLAACGAAPPTPEDVRDWTATSVTIVGAAIDLTQAVLALVAEIREASDKRCVP
jgi:hypothetical protein